MLEGQMKSILIQKSRRRKQKGNGREKKKKEKTEKKRKGKTEKKARGKGTRGESVILRTTKARYRVRVDVIRLVMQHVSEWVRVMDDNSRDNNK